MTSSPGLSGRSMNTGIGQADGGLAAAWFAHALFMGGPDKPGHDGEYWPIA
ncbi:hypothetical protein [Phenylobacterium sp.]|uniref:hypothetical protein n=1 Tax=Phenylobacterium sp. TaxID=1871053 RepID=UPI0025D56A7F|nr:hypothetical protein [Phenylobacterium sp.]